MTTTTSGTGSPTASSDNKDDNAKVMAEFAAAMMRAIKAYNSKDAKHDLQMRIGKNILIVPALKYKSGVPFEGGGRCCECYSTQNN